MTEPENIKCCASSDDYAHFAWLFVTAMLGFFLGILFAASGCKP